MSHTSDNQWNGSNNTARYDKMLMKGPIKTEPEHTRAFIEFYASKFIRIDDLSLLPRGGFDI